MTPLAAFAAGSVVGAAVVTALVALWHHARFVHYHRHTRRPLAVRGRDVLWAEARDTLWLSFYLVRALGRDGWLHPTGGTGRPVLCVHGYTQNGTNFWPLRQRLQAEGRPSRSLSMVPGAASIDWYALRVEQALVEAVEVGDAGVDVVCHSMGGVVLRVVLARRPDLRAQVTSVVTLGSPHAGTAAARGIPWLPEVQALKRRSVLLAELPALPDLVPRAVTVAGTLDTIVYPLDSALVEGAEHVVLPVGHAGLLTDARALQAVVEAVRTA